MCLPVCVRACMLVHVSVCVCALTLHADADGGARLSANPYTLISSCKNTHKHISSKQNLKERERQTEISGCGGGGVK